VIEQLAADGMTMVMVTHEMRFAKPDRLHASRQGPRNRAGLDASGAQDARAHTVRRHWQLKIITKDEN